MILTKKSIKGAIILSVIASSSLYATNGDTLIGVGAKTRAMGGAGIALSHGAESTLVNPALITKVKETEISFGGTIFASTIKTTFQGVEQKSDADLSMIPAVAIASQVMPNIYAGIGMYGTAGMGVDFRGNPTHMDMETTLQLMQFAAPLAYKFNGLSVGISPIIQYGSLDINYKNYMAPSQPKVGYGQTQDFGFGVSVGAEYDFGNGFSIGAVYKSKIIMKYPKVLTTAANPLGVMVGDTLTQPAEYGIGIGYINGPHSFAFDIKKIAWSKAKGYKEFNWSDQTVYAVGYQYDAGEWALRVGYNYAKSPIKNSQNPMINTFNLLGFPATAKSHFTAGGSYKFNNNFSADLTLVYSPESKSSLNAGTPYAISNKHSEFGTTIQFNYKF